MAGFSRARRQLAVWPVAASLSGLGRSAAARGRPDLSVSIDVDADEVVARSAPPMFGFGGNIWLTPGAFGLGIADRILDMPHLGMSRVSLGDQLLEDASSLAELRRRLEQFALNDFLRRVRQRGGRVMLVLDGTPRWLSSNPSTTRQKNPNQPLFRLSPAANLAGWAEVVEAIVRHFNGVLGLDAWYEAWNEPNLYYQGSFEQFMAQYRASVLGARRADPKARIGGPGVGHFNGVRTAQQPGAERERLAAVNQTLEQKYLFQQFIEAAAAMPLPELRLSRLPVDFFSWHGFYLDPSQVYATVTPYIREVLASAGYPRDTPIVNSEWNLAPVPPYPEGDLNATHVGAAFAAASVLAMHAAGVDQQIFQMYVDPGVDGYSGGLWTAQGLARANCHALRLLSMLRGRELRVRSDDPWVRAAAFRDGRHLHVLVASCTPTPEMLKNAENVLGPLRNADFMRKLAREGHGERLLRGVPLPTDRAREAQQREQADGARLRADTERAKARARGTLDLRISVRGLTGATGRAAHWLIDSRHANIAPEVATAARALEGQRRALGRLPEDIRQALRRDGVPAGEADRLVAALAAGRPLDDALATVDARRQPEVRRLVESVVADASAPVRKALAQAEASPQAALVERELDWPASGVLDIEAEPHSVQLFTLRLGA
ncbi:hypothetical protein AACH10_12950 [Ideonella sp. DXS22W]|uniref:Glycosyl hydrolases family 39 N-terminal catalytic domain-containing protein n=1 Tax=Pseudaquabacterium inlustre TaxID=2984192 RepID=A0ABU9CKQ4_9BURK